MKVYCIEQYAYNEDTDTYDICKGVVHVFIHKVVALRFISKIKDADREDGYDFAYFIRTFDL